MNTPNSQDFYNNMMNSLHNLDLSYDVPGIREHLLRNIDHGGIHPCSDEGEFSFTMFMYLWSFMYLFVDLMCVPVFCSSLLSCVLVFDFCKRDFSGLTMKYNLICLILKVQWIKNNSILYVYYQVPTIILPVTTRRVLNC